MVPALSLFDAPADSIGSASLIFHATYNCDHSDDYYVKLSTCLLTAAERQHLVEHLLLRAAARNNTNLYNAMGLSARCSIYSIVELLGRNHFIRPPWHASGPYEDVGELHPENNHSRHTEWAGKPGFAPNHLKDTVAFHMIIPFLEAGKVPLSATEQESFLSSNVELLGELNDSGVEEWEDYIMQGVDGIPAKLKKLKENSPPCQLGSDQWIKHHKEFMSKYRPGWKIDYEVLSKFIFDEPEPTTEDKIDYYYPTAI